MASSTASTLQKTGNTLIDFPRKWFKAVKPPLFRLSLLNFSPNIPDFDYKIRLDRQKTGSFSCS